jgi:two-component sensor histidine kinase
MARITALEGLAMPLMLDKLADGSVPADKPENEPERIQQLRRFCILDTDRDPRFERITALTAQLLDMPVVLVSLVDEAREWFKSAVGTEAAQIPREHGFCAHALLVDGRKAMTVVDTNTDPRFATHPYVVSAPHLRFYSGAPLISASGHKLGMLCVHDVKPRPDFGAAGEGILSRLAAIVMDEIDFHRIESERTLLIGELSHRVKNVISVVQSIARLSARDTPAAGPFVASFSGRLNAMVLAHDRLVSNDWQAASLPDVVTGVLAAHQPTETSAVTVDLPELTIDPPFAQIMALLVHELLTNSIKYGALREPAGRVSFSATRTSTDGVPVVKFRWAESGGPPVAAPDHIGFGHRLLETSVRQKGGTVTFDWQPHGLVCRFTLFELTLAALR